MPGKTASAWACRYSIRWMFRDVGQRTLEDPKTPAMAYLWTFTFPEEEVRLNPLACAARWRTFMNDRRMRKRMFVHVLEPSKRGYWHFHVVTPERWEVDELRLVSEVHGFGRIHVKRVPVSKVDYVAKYLQKDIPGDVRIRRWACHGFVGTKVRSIRITTDSTSRDSSSDQRPAYTRLIIQYGDSFSKVLRLRLTENGKELDQRMKITDTQMKELVKMATNNQPPLVGEYRGFEVRAIKIADDENPNHITVKHVVEYGVEFPTVTGVKAVKCSMWLPTGADAATVKAPATKGEFVVVELTGMSFKYGYQIASIRPLTQLV